MSNDQLKRAYWHDYKTPARYMITLSKAESVPGFCTIELKDPIRPVTPQNIYVRWSKIGFAIADRLYNISKMYPELIVEQYSIMPDHVHFLLFVRENIPEHLGSYIARLKVAINAVANVKSIFQDGYNDQILKNNRSLDMLFRYIRENAYRLAVRQHNPDFFKRINNLKIGDCLCQAYGNIHLLNNPFRDLVIVHRADNAENFARKRDRWLYTAVNGGVLVSPFISRREKEIRNLAEELNGNIILIADRPFASREKPYGRDFNLCVSGRLLIIAPVEPLQFTREACLRMNSIAGMVVGGGGWNCGGGDCAVGKNR